MSWRTANQIADGLEEEIRTNVRAPGSRLPSQIALAEQLGVHRSTVATAYAYLRQRGVCAPAGPGASTRVADAEQLTRALAARAVLRAASEPGQ